MSIESELAKRKSMARNEVDRAVRQLWLAFYELEALDRKEITEADAELNALVAKHSAIKHRLAT